MRSVVLLVIVVALISNLLVGAADNDQSGDVSDVAKELGLELCRRHPVGSMLQNPRDCNKYFVCLGDNDSLMLQCPYGLLFDNERQSCEWISEVSCPDNLRLRVQMMRQKSQ